MVKNVDAVELRIFIVAVLVAAVDAVLVTHHSTLRQYLATRKREVNYLLGVEKMEGGCQQPQQSTEPLLASSSQQ